MLGTLVPGQLLRPGVSNERHFRSIGLTESAVRWKRREAAVWAARYSLVQDRAHSSRENPTQVTLGRVLSAAGPSPGPASPRDRFATAVAQLGLLLLSGPRTRYNEGTAERILRSAARIPSENVAGREVCAIRNDQRSSIPGRCPALHRSSGVVGRQAKAPGRRAPENTKTWGDPHITERAKKPRAGRPGDLRRSHFRVPEERRPAAPKPFPAGLSPLGRPPPAVLRRAPRPPRSRCRPAARARPAPASGSRRPPGP